MTEDSLTNDPIVVFKDACLNTVTKYFRKIVDMEFDEEGGAPNISQFCEKNDIVNRKKFLD